MQRGSCYAAGGILLVLLACLPHLLYGNFDSLLKATMLGPLEYSSAQYSPLDAAAAHFRYVFGISDGAFRWYRPDTLLSVLLWVGGSAGLVVLFRRWGSASRRQRQAIVSLAVFALCTGASILMSGAAYPHYLIQAAPFFALSTGVLIDVLMRTRGRLVVLSLFLLVLLIPTLKTIGRYPETFNRVFETGTWSTGSAYRIADYIRDQNDTDEPIYLMTDHLVYWLIDAEPLTKLAHPSGIGKEFFLRMFLGPDATSDGEMRKILDQRPRYIVKKEKTRYLPESTRKLLENELRESYELVETIEDRRIQRRLNDP